MKQTAFILHGRIIGALVALASIPGGFATPTTAATQTAAYTVRFDGTWSAASHPIGFPPNPHFSGLIGGTHNGNVHFWLPGALASTGIKNMAELGSKTPLDSEVNAAITAGNANHLLSGGGINPSPGNVSLSFQMNQGFPLVTLVSMIAPSPDWFVGVHDLSLFQNGEWVNQVVIPLFAYDAGTDSGIDFVSPNQVTNPFVPITLGSAPAFGNGVPVGIFTFTRTDSPQFATPALSHGMLLLLGSILFGTALIAARRRRV